MIEVSHLTKQFGDFTAVDDVSFAVATGECVGFLGPNGAGKTTTMRTIAGIFPPTSGTVKVAGHDVAREPDAARRKLGYFPEHAPYYPEMSVDGYLAFVARAKRVARKARHEHVERVVGACGLASVRRRLVGKLSKGFRQRVGLAQALLGDPEVLILDEPTSGLDPEQVSEIREVVKSFRGRRTILFSSHILSEVSQVAQRVVIIHRGKIVAEDATEVLARRLAGAVTLWLRIDAPLGDARAAIALVDGVREVAEQGGRLRVAAGDEATVRRVSQLVSARGWPLLELAQEALTLEEIFLRLVREESDRPRDDGRALAAGAER
ncbi:MAG TPA: ABC transporter ATP-binding protein [Candidatus Binatia bacterium]|nr:ABC transporter ATP-binding protein [Candidatus Binatia bacterium]